MQSFSWIVQYVMPEEEIGKIYIARSVHYSIEDMLGMKSLSQKEKEQEITDMIKEDKEELQSTMFCNENQQISSLNINCL